MDVTAKYIASRQKLFEQAGIQPLSKYVETDGPVRTVHYLQMGAGVPLIIVHGGLSHSSEWINILQPLAKNFRLYVVDRPGHGLSDPIDYSGVDYRESAVAFIRSFMDALDLQQAHLMGNSMGGYFTLCFTLEHPERVKKLLLIGAPAGINHWIPPMLRLLGLKGVNRFLMNTIARPSVANARKVHDQLLVHDINHISNDYLEHSYHSHLLPGAKEAHRTLLESVVNIRGWREELYLGDQLHRLKVPVYFVWGDRDEFESPKTGIEKAKTIDNYTFEIIEDAGHCPWLDQPERCTSAIIKMLNN